MKEFVLNLSAIIIICFIFGLILEGTKFEKSANKVFGLIIIANLIISLFSIFIDFSKFYPNINLGQDTAYIENINSYKLNIIKDKIEKNLESLGFSDCGIYFSTESENYNLLISKIYIDFTEKEYKISDENINEVKNKIVEVIQIDKEDIIVYI